jgi:hypothetical protein
MVINKGEEDLSSSKPVMQPRHWDVHWGAKVFNVIHKQMNPEMLLIKTGDVAKFLNMDWYMLFIVCPISRTD